MPAGEALPHLSIVIPTYNEAARIGESLRRLDVFMALKNWQWELVVSDDGSTDDTAGIVHAHQAGHPAHPTHFLPSGKNEGKGNAVRRGVLASRGRYILVTDADLSAPIKEVDKLLGALEKGCEVAVGSRAVPGKNCDVQQSPRRRFAGRVFNLLVRLLALRGYGDTQCGFKCFKKEAAIELFQAQTLSGFCFDVEILILARKKGYNVSEVPVMWREAPGSKVNLFCHSLAMVKELLYLRKHYA
ncbi:MAG: dolichyl-phosphate beta-glucosyltransferase [Candidatus Omnitrophota bacterium]